MRARQYAVFENYATHKHPKVPKWLADHPRWIFHFTPTSASRTNAFEGFFSIIKHHMATHPTRCLQVRGVPA